MNRWVRRGLVGLGLVFLVWVFLRALPRGEPPWPSKATVEQILADRERTTFELRVYRSSSEGYSYFAWTAPGAQYYFVTSIYNLFPLKLPHQYGGYSCQPTEAQLRAVLDLLLANDFPSIKLPTPVIVDTAVKGIRLHYGGKKRFVWFPLDQPVPAKFEAMWAGVLAVLEKCEFTPVKALSVHVALPAECAKGVPVPLDLVVRNIGKELVAIPAPSCPRSKGRTHLTGRVEDTRTPGKPQRQEVQAGAGGADGIEPSLRIPPSDSVKVRVNRALTFDQPGQYSVVVEYGMGLPDGPDEKLGLVGSVVCDACTVTVK
jgi:hypothetical protein